MADLSIYNQLLQAPKSVADYDAEARRAAGDQLSLLAAQYKLADQARASTRATQLDALVHSMPATATDPDRVQAMRGAGFFDQADALEKSIGERAKTDAEVRSKDATTATSAYDLKRKQYEHVVGGLSQFKSPEDARQWLADSVVGGQMPMQQATTMMQHVPQDPAEFGAWRDRTVMSLMDAGKQAGYIKPDANATLQSNTQIATNKATNDTSRANNAATNAAHIQGINIQQSGENARAGVDAQGNPTGNMGAVVDMLGQLKLDPKQALQRLPAGQRANLVAQVQAKYPNWDETTYDAKRGAAQKFTYGDQGNALRSFAVAGQHLDQLGALVDALGNGNVQGINKLANLYAEQTGDPAPTNFDAAKDVVSKEVMKAIVAGGGGQAEREELAHSLSSAKSPAQLRGVIKQYRGLMSAQHDALLQQRRAAGLPDSTLPDYSAGEGAGGSGFKFVGVVK